MTDPTEPRAPDVGLPSLPDITEVSYAIRGADNLVRVVLRNAYAHMGDDRLMSVRVEVRFDTGPDTCDWMTVPGSRIRGLMPGREARELGAQIYHGGWRKIVADAMTFDRSRHPSFWQSYLVERP